MDENLPPNVKTDGSESLDEKRREEGLLITLTETIRALEAVRRHRDHRNGAVTGTKYTGEEPGRGGGVEVQGGSEEAMLSPAECEKKDEERGRCADEEWEERECKKKAARVLRELGVMHSDSLAAWGEALRQCAHMLAMSPAGGSDQRRPSTTGDTECKTTPSSDSFSDTFLSVQEDIHNIMEKLNVIIYNMDKKILKLCAEEASAVAANPKASERPGDDNSYLSSNDALDFDSKLDVEDVCGRKHAMRSPDTEQTSHSRFSDSDRGDVGQEEAVLKSAGSDEEDFISLESQTDVPVETNENVKGKEETNKEWITVGLTGQQEDNHPGAPYACLVRAPPGVSEVLRCDVVDTLSYLMVTGSEELVSRVIRVAVPDGARLHFPVTVVVPFCARYRGSHRDVVVKIFDEEGRSSYITPVTTEGMYGGQRGSLAEVKVYSLGLFAVVLSLKRENYTVPTKGLSLKLPVDPRICLNYLPGSFTAPVVAQIMIQPVDAVLLAAVRSRGESYHAVVSTSPLLHLSHPTSQPLRRPLTLILPCPPNPEKKRQSRGQGRVQDHQARGSTAPPPWDQLALPLKGIPVASAKTKEMSDDSLIALGSRDKLWSVLDKATVRNQQNGLVSLEVTENFDRLLVARLLSPLQPRHLASLAEELEEAVCRHAVTVVLRREQGEPRALLVAAVPSRDLGWELSRLRARGHGGLLETSSEIPMCEGDQLVLRFGGNITSTGAQDDPRERIAFHGQQRNLLSVRLKEVDPFGNHSSPHYKGTVTFHRIPRGQPGRRGDAREPTDAGLLGDPVCKLSLTLPKKVRTINRPAITRVKLCEESDFLSDSLLLWLSGQLSEEEVAALVLSLRLRRSAAQLVKLRAGDSPSTQAFHALAMWRRGLPAATHQPKASQLAHCLAKGGRPDLARELLVRQAAATRRGPLKQGNLPM